MFLKFLLQVPCDTRSWKLKQGGVTTPHPHQHPANTSLRDSENFNSHQLVVRGCLPFSAVKRERRESSRDPPGPGGGRRFLELFPFSCAPLPLGKVLACSERWRSGAGTADSTTAWNAPCPLNYTSMKSGIVSTLFAITDSEPNTLPGYYLQD